MKNNWLSISFPEEHRLFLFELVKFLESSFESKNQKFNIMKKEDLHMTSVFLGKQFNKKDHDKLFEIISRFNFNECKFVINSVILFPPTKNNLIIVKYDTDKVFHNELKKLRSAIRSELSYDIEDDDFIPHVTLGKLSLTKIEIKELSSSKIIENIYNDFLTNDTDRQIISEFKMNNENSMYMCGSD
jgi:2'-5' RNA ligase